MAKPNEFKLTIGEEKVLYISTLSDLGGDMLKLDFPMGEYELYPLYQGYYLGVKDYSPKDADAIQVFYDRGGHKGIAGTYYSGDTDNVHRVRIFNQYVGEHLSDEWWKCSNYEFETDESEISEFEIDESITDESEMDESKVDQSKTDVTKTNESKMDVSIMYKSFYHGKRGIVNDLKDYNNIPVFFYITKQLKIDDLSYIKLECAPEINDCGNIDVCWYVIHSTEGKIGIAVKQKQFFDMMGDQAGLTLFSSNGFRAVGNFDYYNIDHSTLKTEFDEDVFYPDHLYQCEFKPCFCDFEYEYVKKRRLYWENMRKNKPHLFKYPTFSFKKN